ncbi:MAG: carboxypeptidase regulatory-like domain-containing protein [Sedimentisphaerales bacterium]|nr:carboxypeptidase regulatory-like domain-containing protein [Sedimentisphaerales bacterium]
MLGRKILVAGPVVLAFTAAVSILYAADQSGIHIRFTQDSPVAVTVSGKVSDEATGQPISNARVRGHLTLKKNRGPEMFDKSARQESLTDAQGHYQLIFDTPLTTTGPGKGEDTLCVYVGAEGYETQPRYVRPRVTPEHKEVADFDFALVPGKRVKGRVVDPEGQLVEGAVIRAQNSYNSDWNFFGSLGRTTSADDGSFELWIGPAGRDYQSDDPWLCIHKQGQGVAFVWDILDTEDVGDVELLPCGSITGKVIDGAGAPVADCEVSARGWPCGLIDRTTTDSEGRYALNGVPGIPSIVDFYQRKNKQYNEVWGYTDVYARVDPQMNLRDVPQYRLKARDGEVVTGPDLTVGTEAGVSGRLVAADVPYGLNGLLVRLDTSWANMVEADFEGRFHFPFVSPGKHTLTAYLPHNLRYDRGIGRVTLNVQPGSPLTDVEIPLESLAELRVQYLDADGNPLKGISGSATWSRNGHGAWTEGTQSNGDGWAVLYLYPGSVQYVRGFDRSRQCVAETFGEVRPKPGQIMDPIQIVMVSAAELTGRFLDEQGAAISGGPVFCVLDFADGIQDQRRIGTGPDGSFRLERLTPGIVSLSVKIGPVVYRDVLGDPVELTPGDSRSVGDLTLADGLDTDKTIKRKHAHAMEHADEVREAAEQLFDKIRAADYERFRGEEASWPQFPIVGYYMTHHYFDVLVQWMCETFQGNPIVRVELGAVFANEHEVHGYTGLPTVPYKVVLKDGTVLEGCLPFEYNFDGDVGHWHGLQGIDWHLEQRLQDPATAPR